MRQALQTLVLLENKKMLSQLNSKRNMIKTEM